MKRTLVFPISVDFVPERFEEVNSLLGTFGLGRLSLKGEIGDAKISFETVDSKPLPSDMIEEMRKVLQEAYDKALEGKIKITVEKGYERGAAVEATSSGEEAKGNEPEMAPV